MRKFASKSPKFPFSLQKVHRLEKSVNAGRDGRDKYQLCIDVDDDDKDGEGDGEDDEIVLI